ncbi:DUF4426 domain-containing protein [Lysobacter humi (ex Lee et al. 2017)]
MRSALLLACLLTLAACGGGAPRPAEPMPQSQQEASVRIGDVTARASVIETTALDEAVARGYGIARSDRTALLLVALRRGENGDVSVPARVTATATDLRGNAQPVTLRELRSGDLLDYVGTVAIDPPDTLRFDVRVVVDGAASTMRFSRELHAR